MPQVTPLPTSRLHAICDSSRLPWKDSEAIPEGRHLKTGRNPFQPRAMEAMDLALQIPTPGYNIYLSGESGLGRTYMLLAYLEPRAHKLPVPPDLIYTQNFANADSPIFIELPAGYGKKFKADIGALIENIGKNLEQRFETLTFARQKTCLVNRFQNQRSSLLASMNQLAANNGFNLDIDDAGGITLSPLVEGRRLSEEDFGRLSSGMRIALKRKGDNLAKKLVGYLKQLNHAEESLHEDERHLEAKAMGQTLDATLAPLVKRWLKTCPSPVLENYFTSLREDILKNTDAFLRPEQSSRKEDGSDNFFARYGINLFVDNSAMKGAPIIVEDNPTCSNLLGCIERESELGALVTDFSLIRSGSLHRANGGFLVIHVRDLIEHPSAWEGLLRSLRANEARIEDGGDSQDGAIRTKGLHPPALELNVKVILIGDEDVYEALLINEERFAKLFRIKAHMTDMAERNTSNIRFYLAQMARIIHDAALLPFDSSALAWLVDLGSHLCEDQRRLSLKFPLLREQMIEANALAQLDGFPVVTADILEQAYAAKSYRDNLVEEDFMENYDREVIKVSTHGKAIGQVNGLSISWCGEFEFGLPHRISCSVGVGHDGIIDLEREAELGGPIHTKAMMILKSYLTGLFARKKPLVLSASLHFEQSYAGIEGDSASGAELAALISALAEIPVRLDLAFTGAVSHSGQIMAVGGVTRKIEGFYKVCARHRLTGTQGVIIPYDNIDHLMLSPDILESVEKKQFAIYAVKNIEEALELLTGLPAGKRRKNDTFTPGSLYDRVDRRLENLGASAQNSFRRTRRDQCA